VFELDTGRAIATRSRTAGAHHRPPRLAVPRPLEPLEAPMTPPEPERPRLSIATLAVPLATGVVLAGLYGPQLAIVAIIGPLVALGGWLVARRTAERASRRAHREHDAALERFTRDVRAQRDYATSALRSANPPLYELVAHSEQHDPRLWERRRDDDDFLRLSLGVGSLPWRAETTRQPDADATKVLDAAGGLDDVPITVEAEGLVGVCGPRALAVATARSLAIQVATLHGPADVRVGALTSASHAPDWRWVRWLPTRSMSAITTAGWSRTRCSTRLISSSRQRPASSTQAIA
jgi:S-DNA-T family DNA segregation ATPase FtsK/SpoIIIE